MESWSRSQLFKWSCRKSKSQTENTQEIYEAIDFWLWILSATFFAYNFPERINLHKDPDIKAQITNKLAINNQDGFCVLP